MPNQPIVSLVFLTISLMCMSTPKLIIISQRTTVWLTNFLPSIGTLIIVYLAFHILHTRVESSQCFVPLEDLPKQGSSASLLTATIEHYQNNNNNNDIRY